MYFPTGYDKINLMAGTTKPATEKSYNNKSFAFWERSLFQRASSVIDFVLPDEWSGDIADFFIYCLFRFGFVCISENNTYGRFFQPCTISGFNFYYQPTRALISNPLYNADLEIGKECELLKLTPDYMGIWDIITYYAEKLSLLDIAINTSLINAKMAWILGARNKAAGQAIKKALDKINSGQPAVIYDTVLTNDRTDKAEPWQFLDFGNIKERYITTDQLRDFQTLINNFDAEIGIPTIPYEKKERMVSDEAGSRQLDSVSRCTVWMRTLKESIKAVNQLYPDINISVKFRDDINIEGVADNGNE